MTGARGPRTSTALLEAAVVACFDPATALSRTEIADRTGLSRTVVTSLVNALVERGRSPWSRARGCPARDAPPTPTG
ncbi:helix-turn-helix domain-containing protein [Streptacidiphilus monticola]